MTHKTMERRLATAPLLELRAKDGKRGTIEGYAAVFNSRSEEMFGFREIIRPGAFKKTLGDGHDIYALADHDTSRRLARTKIDAMTLVEDDKGLRVSIDLPDTQLGRDIEIEVRTGLLDAMSFGFATVKDNWHQENGETIRELRAVELFEVSVVSWAAYRATSVDIARRDRWLSLQENIASASALKRRRMAMSLALATRA